MRVHRYSRVCKAVADVEKKMGFWPSPGMTRFQSGQGSKGKLGINRC